MERQHVRALAQDAVDHILDDGCARVGALALAVDDAHAAVVVLVGLGQEASQQPFGLQRRRPMQVQFVLRGELPALEALEHARRHDIATMAEHVARRVEIERLEPPLELAARIRLVLLGHACAGFRRRLAGRRWHLIQAPNLADRIAEQGGIVVVGGRGLGHATSVAASPYRDQIAQAREARAWFRYHGASPRKPMRVLVSNDDGVDAPGIRILAEGLRSAGHEVYVVAPDRDRSGASNSLTLDLPIRLKRIDHYTCSIAGTPTDCVHLALTGMLEFEPDIVVSGINNTANLGDDVIYSGTVSAAMEGRFLGLPAVAMSLATKNHDAKHYETAARAAVEIVARLKADPLPADTILNVNVPDLAWADVRGFEVTRLGNRHRSEPCVPQPDPRGHTVYWIGPAGREQDAGPGTDFHAVRTGHISITPIHVDLTRYQALEKVAGWVGGLTAALEDSA